MGNDNSRILAAHQQEIAWYKEQSDNNNKMMQEVMKNLVSDQQFRAEVKNYETKQLVLQEKAIRLTEQLQLTEAAKTELQSKLAMDIRHSYEKEFPMSPELQEMKKKYPYATFVNVLGSSGTGKSTLMNTFLVGPTKIDEDDFEEVFKTDAKECTLVTQFHNISEQIKERLDNNQVSWFEREGKQFPTVFLCDQPGIGGMKISAQGYMQKFAPGHYDFTVATTASRLMENEYFSSQF